MSKWSFTHLVKTSMEPEGSLQCLQTFTLEICWVINSSHKRYKEIAFQFVVTFCL